jgi:hypothetical protein
MALFDSIRLTLLIGPELPLPAPPTLIEALQSVEVTHRDDGPSGFQLSFALTRGTLLDVLDYTLLLSGLLSPFNRVVIGVMVNGVPDVLIDGIITHREHKPDVEPGDTLLTITGEDVSVMMDLEEKRVSHPGLPDIGIVAKIVLQYAQYGLIPNLQPPLLSDVPLPVQRVPTQQGTDLEMLRTLAQRNGFVFYVRPGVMALTNIAYFGPPNRLDLPQPALAVGLGHHSNVESLEFSYNGLAATRVADIAQDSMTGVRYPLQTFASTRVPPLALSPALTPLSTGRSVLFEGSSGLDVMQGYARAQARTDLSTDPVVTARGEIDVLRYGRALQAGGVVGVRGAGYTHDGLYHVAEVTHRLAPRSYTQAFMLNREGEIALAPVVAP